MKPFSTLVQHGPRPFLSPLSPRSFTTKASISSPGKCLSHSPPKSPIPSLFYPCKAPFFFFFFTASWSFFNDRSNFVHSLYAGVESSRLSVRRCLPEKISTSFEPDRASEDGFGQIQVSCASLLFWKLDVNSFWYLLWWVFLFTVRSVIWGPLWMWRK